MTQQLNSLVLSEAHVFIEIEQWVEQIILLSQKAEWQANWQQQCSNSADLCQAIHNHLPRWASFLSDDYSYSEHLKVFYWAVSICGLRDKLSISENKRVWRNPPTINECQELIQFIMAQCNTREFKRQIHDRKFQISKNESRLSNYAGKLHAAYARLLVVRVDLSYIKAEQSNITIDDVYRHLKEFIRPVSARYSLFKHMVGHAYTIEQGIHKGYHIHAIFYFKGRHQWKDWYQGKEIIRLWEQITCNKGCGYNCNAGIKSYIKQNKCGIGMIMRNDEHAVNCSIKAACYLTRIKEDPQHLRARPHAARSFNTGSLKKAIKRSRSLSTES